MYAVMCCGCGRMLKEDGTLTVESAYTLGVLDVWKVQDIIEQDAQRFGTHADADSSAVTHGWAIRDKDDKPNHRCPGCRVYESSFHRFRQMTAEPVRRGAYILIEGAEAK